MFRLVRTEAEATSALRCPGQWDGTDLPDAFAFAVDPQDAFAGKGGYVADVTGDDLADPGAGAERDDGERLVAWRGQAWTARR